MGTKTIIKKAIPLEEFLVEQIKISDADAEKLAECCGFEHDHAKIASLRNDVDRVISWHAHELKLALLKPYESEQKAHLTHIQECADALRSAIDYDAMSLEVRACLVAIDLNQLQRTLKELMHLAEEGAIPLKSNSSGEHNKVKNGETEEAGTAFGAVFDDQVIHDYGDDKDSREYDRKEFVATCKKYLSNKTPR